MALSSKNCLVSVKLPKTAKLFLDNYSEHFEVSVSKICSQIILVEIGKYGMNENSLFDSPFVLKN